MANSAKCQDELDRLRAENAELKRRLLALEGNESDEKREEEPITAQRDEVDNGNGGKFEYCPSAQLVALADQPIQSAGLAAGFRGRRCAPDVNLALRLDCKLRVGKGGAEACLQCPAAAAKSKCNRSPEGTPVPPP